MIASTFSEPVPAPRPPRHVASCFGFALLALVISVIVFAPHLWLMREHVPGSFQWARADGFMLQCAEPFRRDVEPALHWRLLPPLVCHALGLHGRAALIFPWLGLLGMLAFAGHALRSRLDSWRVAAPLVILLASTSAVISATDFFGINDGWNWFALLLVSFSRARWILPLVALVFPWCDERVVIGFTLALVVRAIDRDEPPRWQTLLPLVWLTPYVAVRLVFIRDSSTQLFFGDAVRESLHYFALAPLGWWMAFRAGWIPIAAVFAFASPAWRWWLASILVLTLLVSVVLAADLSRSAAIACPLLVLGSVLLCRRWPAEARRLSLVLCIASLLIPAAHIVHTKIDPVSPLPVELFRLFRSR